MMPRGKPVAVQNPDDFLEILKDGDIICRLGDRLWSRLFKDVSVSDRRYSHLGIIRIDNGQVTVIHAEGTAEPGRDFVKEEPLDDFAKIARAIGIYRANGVDGNQISSLAVEYLGVPFDWQFNLDDEERLYCTELLHVILKRIDPKLELKTIMIKGFSREIIPLDSISHSELFSEIYFADSRSK
jgi:hypothetical protein